MSLERTYTEKHREVTEEYMAFTEIRLINQKFYNLSSINNNFRFKFAAQKTQTFQIN
jgi:hypothetical protein